MVIILKTFYIFKLNRNYHKVAKSNPFNIYALLNSIYTYKKGDVTIAFDLFKEICIPINKDFFNNYYFSKLKELEEYTKFKNIHMYNDYLTGEVSKMIVNNSHIIIKANKSNNIFVNNIIDTLFICDFKNNYFKYIIYKEKNKLESNKKDNKTCLLK